MACVLHLIDRVAAGVMRVPRLVPRFFPDGWGDRDAFEFHRRERRDPPPASKVEVEWLPNPTQPGRMLGTFTSPSEALPAPARRARVLWMGAHHHRQVVLLAASNDHTWRTREAVASHLLNLGIGSVILENPYYGARRVRDGQALATVADFFRMGSATVAEARALLVWLSARGHAPGVAGFSQGGSVAAHVSALAPLPVATACMAAGPSPAPVFTEGIIATTIDWDALGGKAAALPRLRAELDDVTVTRYEPAEHHARAVVAGGRRDAYVAPGDVAALAGHWPGAELVWLDGGHASFHLYGKSTQAVLIRRAFDRFERFTRA